MSSTLLFGDLSTPTGLGKLNEHLKHNSYIQGYEPSATDNTTFNSIKNTSNQHPYITRWFNHIKSFGEGERKSWTTSTAPLLTKPSNAAAPTANDDDDVDLFASDEEEEDADSVRVREARLKAYADKKQAKGPGPIAKSSVVLDVKPWDDETDMSEIERLVRTIGMEGLVWGASKLVPLAYGIKKLQIMCVVEDEKVSIDLLTETITEFEDFVQSVDVAAFNKI